MYSEETNSRSESFDKNTFLVALTCSNKTACSTQTRQTSNNPCESVSPPADEKTVEFDFSKYQQLNYLNNEEDFEGDLYAFSPKGFGVRDQ